MEDEANPVPSCCPACGLNGGYYDVRTASGWVNLYSGVCCIGPVTEMQNANAHIRITCAHCATIVWTNFRSYRWVWAAEGLQDGGRVVFGGSIVCGDYLHAAVEIDHRLRKNNPNVVWVQMGVMETSETIFLPAMWRKELSA